MDELEKYVEDKATQFIVVNLGPFPFHVHLLAVYQFLQKTSKDISGSTLNLYELMWD